MKYKEVFGTGHSVWYTVLELPGGGGGAMHGPPALPIVIPDTITALYTSVIPPLKGDRH